MEIVKKLFLLLGLILSTTISATAQTTNHISADDLLHLSLPEVVLESATPVAPEGRKGSYLQVKGTIGGSILFELLLPDAWNGRFVMGGGGGFVGSVQNSARDSVNHGYATVGTDTGHEWQPGYSAGWAYTNLEAQLNFGYLGVHRTAEVAKSLIHVYYGTNAAYSYFTGCSRGGGQAMMEAQRFPKDFDGIVSGAPAFDWTGIAANAVTISKALYPDSTHLDKTVLDKRVLQKLQQAILDQCDAQDGLKDGIVQDPPSTHFDLAKVPDLTDEQRKAIAAIYAGARDNHGPIYPGYQPGAEVDPDQWIAWIVGPVPQMVARDHAPDLIFAFGTQIFKYLVFNQPDWDYSTYNFTNFENDTRLAASFLNATNVNLDGLKARNGKLIIWHGWADPALPAERTVDYYVRLQARDSNAADYCRLFMVPGCLHCGGGPGATEVDWLSAIVNWVEHGKAPSQLTASKSGRGTVVMTRSLYNFPRTAIYKGTGDPNSAESFEPKSP